MKFRLSALALATTVLVGCASSGKDSQGRSDPLEGFNRTMYSFNFNVLDPYVVRPVAVVWRDYVPQPARNGLSNFTSNLEEPAVMVNFFLQGDPYQGMVYALLPEHPAGDGRLDGCRGCCEPEIAAR